MKKKNIKRGFALVVTLSLMILLTVIAVGLLTLSSISLRTSSQGQASAEARANARLALAMALGQLQNELGPDGRISAAHDAGTTPAGGQAHWVAVYDAWSQGAPGDPESPTSRGTPKFRSWLTSDFGTGATGGTIRLLDKGTLGSAAPAADIVTVPFIKTVDGNRKGRIAWWTSDEGQKAKVNAGKDDTPERSFGDTTDAFLFAQSPPNIDQQAVPSLASFSWPESEGARAKTITSASMDLAAGLKDVRFKESFHDATVHSNGMLTDVRGGRLQRDMSNLLTRGVDEIESKPLYLADGRINRYAFGKDGKISNESYVGNWKDTGAKQWGINLEELHLFHNIHREVDWAGGKPKLVTKNTREQVVADRYHLYKRPVNSATQYLYSLSAKQLATPKTPPFRYTMQANQSAMVALWNPNDIDIVYPPGLLLTVQLRTPPYDLKLTAPGKVPVTTYTPSTFSNFQGHVGGGIDGTTASGFTINPGESAVFGTGIPKSSGNKYQLNLQRGFDPKTNTVASDSWKLNDFFTQNGTGANEVKVNPSQPIDFEFNRIASAAGNGVWTYTNMWIGERKLNTPQKGYHMETMSVENGSLNDNVFPAAIKSPSAPRPISDYVDDPQPVLSLNFLYNVEQPDGLGALPDAYPSRFIQLGEPAGAERKINPSEYPKVAVNNTQLVVSAEPMNFTWTTLVAGSGENIYHGGGRQPNPGVLSFVHRRIPLTPPMSFGAFQNAIACGFSEHYAQAAADAQGDAYGPGAVALSGRSHLAPLSSHTIGNSWSFPQLAGGVISDGTYTDHSWLANNALWDPWFLSGIVEDAGTNPWFSDSRSPEKQFVDFAKGIKPLRNTRYVYTGYETPDVAATTLFSGGKLKPDAISLLARYLMVDGAFNVNSTSKVAWRAFLGSMKSQSLVTANGTTNNYTDAFGTLGYAVNPATTGTEAMWNGLRELSDAQLDKLAETIVDEVKSRGPFLSLADFVNRRPDASGEIQVVGALQAAIDKADLNAGFTGSGDSLNAADFAGLKGASSIEQEPAKGRARAAGAAGNLTQADLLTALGSQIAVRSDTFTIRSYGASMDATGNNVVASAWCEAVVQRRPEYVDAANTPEESEDWLTNAGSFSQVNASFGRKFQIISFRWLSANEI